MIRGVVAPDLQTGFKIDYALLGLVFSASSLGYLGASFVSGLLTDRFGIKAILLVGVLCMIGGTTGIVFAWNYPTLVAGFTLAGVGSGTMEIGTNSLVPHVAGREQSRYFNFLHALYGAGATVSPVVAGLLLRGFHMWRLPYAVLLAMLLGLAISIAARRYPTRGLRANEGTTGTTDRVRDKAEQRALLRSPRFYLLLFAITIYVTAEVGVGSWLPLLLRATRGITVAVGASYVAGFYLAFTLGRFVGSVVVHRVGSVRSIVATAFAAAVLIVAAEFGPSALEVLFAASGFFFGTIFPTISAVTSESFPNQTGTVIGLLFTGAGVGAMASSWLIGVLADAYGIRIGFLLVAVSLLCVVGLMLAYGILSRRAVRSSRQLQPEA